MLHLWRSSYWLSKYYWRKQPLPIFCSLNGSGSAESTGAQIWQGSGLPGASSFQSGGLPRGRVVVPGVGAYRREPQGSPNPVSYSASLNESQGTSLVVQWLRIRLPKQGTWVWSLIREDPTCRGATKPVRHNYWACALEPVSCNYWSPCA